MLQRSRKQNHHTEKLSGGLRLAWLVGLVFFCQIILAACGDNTATSVPATTGASPTSTPQRDQILVGFIVQAENNPFFPKLKEATEQEAQLKGAKLVVASDATPEGQAAAIENMVSLGVKGILILPIDLKKTPRWC